MSHHDTRGKRPAAEHYVPASKPMSRAEFRAYDKTRRVLYPETYKNKNPSKQAEIDETDYKTAQKAAEGSIEEYHLQYTHHAGDEKIHDLSDAKHSSLLTPASDAAVNTGWHAHARDLFLVKHPYGYSTRHQRRKHEDNLDRAIREANEYSEIYAAHAIGAAGDLHGGLAGKAVAGHPLNPADSADSYAIDDDDDDGYNDGEKGSRDSSDDGRELVESYQAKFAASSRGS